MKLANVAEKRISNNTKLLDQINLITRCEDNNITKYFQNDELRVLLQPCNEKEYLKTFHLSISSLPYHCSEHDSPVSNCRINFGITGITESRLKGNQKALQDINIPNYNTEHCPTEGPNGGALIYIKNDIIYKVRNDLKIYQRKKLESVFIEIINPNNRNIIVGCVYCHPSMEVNEFNSLFLNTLSENLFSEKNKKIVLLGDFNIDRLKYEKDHNATYFLDQMYSTSLVPHITSPTQINSRSRTQIDNIFSTDISENVISENIVTSISNDLAQFLFLPIDQFKTNNNKNIFRRNLKSFNQQIFLENIQNLNWNNVLELEKKRR